MTECLSSAVWCVNALSAVTSILKLETKVSDYKLSQQKQKKEKWEIPYLFWFHVLLADVLLKDLFLRCSGDPMWFHEIESGLAE